MNSTSCFQAHSFPRLALLLALCALFFTTSIQPARADAAPSPDPTIGGAGPYQPQKTNVQMMSETVLLKLSQEQVPGAQYSSESVRVSASFTMQNQGKDEEKMQVIFPLTNLGARGTMPEYQVDPASFVVQVDGQPVPVTEITTPPEKGYELEYDPQTGEPSTGFSPDVIWAAFDVTFPVKKNVLILVEYDMQIDSGRGFTRLSYILETGAGWYGKILSADLIIQLPYPALDEIIGGANPGYKLSGNEIRWHLKNIEPTRSDNLSVSLIAIQNWRAILDLRSKVAQDPADADAWNKLGDGYMALAISNHRMDMISYSVFNGKFVEPAKAAYQKALALRPAWGDPHFNLAQISWAQNVGRDNLQIEDPAIRKMLNDLDLAWSYGIQGNWEVESLLENINEHIPGLELKQLPAATPTAISTSATATPGVKQTQAPTATAQPTVNSPLTSPEIVDKKNASLRLVPAGRFDQDSKAVYLDAFEIDQYEVTNVLYRACVKAGVCTRPKQTYSFTHPDYYSNPKFDNYPVLDVTWEMARSYCETWRGARLPSDAEWEKAGHNTPANPYPWGSEITAVNANYNRNVGDTSAVGSYEKGKSVYGVHDLSGNAWEWVSTLPNRWQSSSDVENPLGLDSFILSSNSWRWIRGGSWYNDADALKLSNHILAYSDYASLLIGFRCARSVPPVTPLPQVSVLPAAKKIVDEQGVSMRMVPAGEFIMGSPAGDANEGPSHTVSLPAYAIDQYEVTNALYNACVKAGDCKAQRKNSASADKYASDPKFDRYPVVSVSWNMAKTFCEWRGARLPSEAEWEKAARGTDGRTYPWGEGIDSSLANFNGSDTAPVGSYEKGQSVYGVYDLTGNVWEWVNDWYEESYYQSSPASNPQGPQTGKSHVLRGGSWYFNDGGLRASSRSFGLPDYTRVTVGFRCASSLP